MAATNITTPVQPTATKAATTLTQAANNDPAVQAANQAQNQSPTAASTGPGIFDWQLPNILPSLDQFLGLPTIIDYQDIGIRVAMVLTGIILLLLVAWAFVRGKQSTTVNVQVPPGENMQGAEEVAEVA